MLHLLMSRRKNLKKSADARGLSQRVMAIGNLAANALIFNWFLMRRKKCVHFCEKYVSIKGL